MRANISINTDGITQPSVKPEPPDGGASVKRGNQSFFVTISANPPARALSASVRTLHTIETKVELHGAGGYDNGHFYKVEILSGTLLDIDVLQKNLFRLGQLSFGKLDVPSALQRISEVGIKKFGICWTNHIDEAQLYRTPR